jgi:glutamate racemase
VAEILRGEGLLRPSTECGNHHYFVTDVPAGFVRVGNRLLGGRLGDVYQINLEDDMKGEE